MAYEARRTDDEELEKAQSDAANQKAAKAGLKAVSNTGGWWGAAAKAIDKADDVTGGKITEGAGKLTTQANKVVPLGKTAQKLTNKVADSKLADKAYDAYNAKNSKGKSAADKVGAKGKDLGNQMKKGGEQKDSLPSSNGKKSNPNQAGGHAAGDAAKDKAKEEVAPVDDKKDKKGSGFFAGAGIAPIAIVAAPFFLIFVFIIIIISTVTNFADYEDAFGVSQVAGADTGGLDANVSNPEQQAFYNRIMDVVNSFQSDGKTVDPLMIVSVYHALTTHGVNISYSDMNSSRITQIANAMFDDNVYSEETFKSNLKNSVIPSYLSKRDSDTLDIIVKEVFDYVDRYYSLIGKEKDSCTNDGTCTYGIKGFYINGSNYKKEMSVNNLYVRLMQCESYNGHNAGGQWGKPLEGEELVPFEKYILGVAYQEIGPSAPEEAFKAQMIAARSYILARPTQMGSSTPWRTLKEEDGKWVLQVASCTADQVYCDPDKGCSSVDGDAQWKQVHSGTSSGKIIKGPLDTNSPLRRYAKDVQGETLVNKNGYIVLTSYTNTESNEFTDLANKGLDYKQILMQVYSKKYPKAGNFDISKASCGVCESSNGEYAKWKQYEGEWVNVTLGNSGRTIKQIGCLATSLAIQVAKSGVQTNISDFNPGTFVKAMSAKGAFGVHGDLLSYASVQNVAPTFRYENVIDISGMNKEAKFNKIKEIVNQPGVYAVAEVMGNTGQHWVAIDSVKGDIINMMDPGSKATNMWKQYKWYNTSRIVYYRVS